MENEFVENFVPQNLDDDDDDDDRKTQSYSEPKYVL